MLGGALKAEALEGGEGVVGVEVERVAAGGAVEEVEGAAAQVVQALTGSDAAGQYSMKETGASLEAGEVEEKVIVGEVRDDVVGRGGPDDRRFGKGGRRSRGRRGRGRGGRWRGSAVSHGG